MKFSIPEDIRETVRAFCDMNDPSEDSVAALVAAERERCARIAKEMAKRAAWHRPTGFSIARAIRNPDRD